MSDAPHVITFDTLTEHYQPIVGGKCASLGTMSQAGLPVPPGFAVTTAVFAHARDLSETQQEINDLLADTDVDDSAALAAAGGPDQSAHLVARAKLAATDLGG